MSDLKRLISDKIRGVANYLDSDTQGETTEDKPRVPKEIKYSGDKKICVWDIETSLVTVQVFRTGEQYIRPEQIVNDTNILCISWQILGEEKVHHTTILDDGDATNDKNVIVTFRDYIEREGVDILLAYNGDGFDYKYFNAKVIEYRLLPLGYIQTIDPLKELRKVAKFSSHKMGFVAEKLGTSRKTETNRQLWIDATAGEPEAIAKMVAYCDDDIIALRDLYIELRPYMKSHPNVARRLTHNCPKCGSTDTMKNGIRHSKSGIESQRYQCQTCLSYFSDRKSKKAKPLSKV